MKKLLLLALTALMMVGCKKQKPCILYEVFTYDSCEYVRYTGTQDFAHKGNCRFCKERRQKELEELVSKLKEE